MEKRKTLPEIRAEQNKLILEMRKQRKSFSQISDAVGIGVNAVIVRLWLMEEKEKRGQDD